MRRIAAPEPGCLILDLEMLLLSLEFPELDGLPVVHQVKSMHTKLSVVSLLTKGKNNITYWPVLPNIPTFNKGVPGIKDMCVGQLLGLLQFRIVPRHPVKGCLEKFANWGFPEVSDELTWKTTLHLKSQPELKKRTVSAIIVSSDTSDDDDE